MIRTPPGLFSFFSIVSNLVSKSDFRKSFYYISQKKVRIIKKKFPRLAGLKLTHAKSGRNRHQVKKEQVGRQKHARGLYRI
ncbi:hypothetical protein Mboo_1536 [Methanoregula boonei 6A8]|uniref:Uncharacterized protein n=1 Tax=Methanoregula boonei (strain DSM 21154 / JCM 14090 / 6A8) TaxID=456442 RepID=A7I8J2_METB6|nr:hypothetical protein Mboo_1536 [Methanoregula boonei 6A8]